MYIVTNGRNYLKTNMKLTPNIKEAKKFPNIAMAEQAKKSMKRTFKKMGFWEVIKYDDTQQKNNSESVNENKNKVTSIISIDKNYASSFGLTETISNSYKELLQYKIVLEQTIAKSEQETQDVLHFIEFYDLDAYNGFMIYKKLQQIRVKRRNAKNELERVSNFLKADFANISNWKSNKKEKKSYTPRVLFDLFKRKWKKHMEERKENSDEESK